MRLVRGRFILAGVLVAVAAVTLLYGLSFAYFCLTPAKSGSKDTWVIEIHKGQGVKDVVSVLVLQGIVTDGGRLIGLGRWTRQWKKMKAGEYQVSPGMSPLEILAVITSGISLNYPITIREGENIFEIGSDLESKKLVEKERFLSLCRDPKFIQSLGLGASPPSSLEGYLFPDTYFLNRSMSVQDILHQMVKKFQATWGQDLEERARGLGLNQHQAITLASMIEKETGAGQERPLISSVFHNRLRKRMRLQSDPTTVYGIWERFDGNLRKADLESKTPYNTYSVTGLPIGPIGNPGKEAIHAALYPANSDFLFFVSHNDGTHQFSRTYEDHVLAVRQFQLDPKAREGKSWRDLSRVQNQKK